jgi:hypothetical protein
MKAIEEILREMRKMGENYSISESNDCRYVAYWLGTTFADRIEAAVKALEADCDNWRRQALDEDARANATHKDSLEVGNAAKMREVLDEIRVAAMSDYEPDADYLIETCNAALSAPPRNCDIMSLDDARKVWFMKEIMPRLDGKLPLGKEKPFDEWFVSQLEQ